MLTFKGAVQQIVIPILVPIVAVVRIAVLDVVQFIKLVAVAQHFVQLKQLLGSVALLETNCFQRCLSADQCAGGPDWHLPCCMLMNIHRCP